MMIDRLLKNRNWFIENYKSFTAENVMVGIRELFDLIQNSMVIDAHNVATYFGMVLDSNLSMADIPNVRPTAQTMWFEYQIVNHLTKISNKGNVQLFGNQQYFIGVFLYDFAELETKSGVLCYGFVEGKDGFNMFGPFGYEYLKKDGSFLGIKPLSSHRFSLDVLQNNEEILNNYTEGVRGYLQIPLLSLSFMHCKNVIIESHDPPVKLQKARQKRRYLPMVRHHTLEIKPMIKILNTEGQAEKLGIKQALHICRGHFKDYSQGKGLFGKYKGLYWWDMQARGNAKEGIVLKDYKVTTGVKEIN